MTNSPAEIRNRDIVRQVYDAAFSGDVAAFRAAMHEEFEENVPSVLPWGGVHRGPDAFFRDVLPKFGAAVDLQSIRVVSLSADGEHVAALLSGRSTAGDELWIAEHWILRDEKLWRMRNFYFDTAPLLKESME